MKKLQILLTGLVLLVLLSVNVKGQDKTDYFIGKWDIFVAGTPNGDVKFILSLERKDGLLSGTVNDAATNAEISKVTKVEEKDQTITAYFFAEGHDLSLFLDKKDDVNVVGNLLNMFDATGKRITEAK
ncbi:hypothetical protein IWX76_000513 [Pedobacter sp. CAN_A7]|uniref:hypothetical protein n=1 Tax=Pedobacter sp. CAN_A7 TaxID=2787722 RepID=UPI0018C96494